MYTSPIQILTYRTGSPLDDSAFSYQYTSTPLLLLSISLFLVSIFSKLAMMTHIIPVTDYIICNRRGRISQSSSTLDMFGNQFCTIHDPSPPSMFQKTMQPVQFQVLNWWHVRWSALELRFPLTWDF